MNTCGLSSLQVSFFYVKLTRLFEKDKSIKRNIFCDIIQPPVSFNIYFISTCLSVSTCQVLILHLL